jgi:2-polyprenyl-6-methoxyphenol hydroxylase-like FAD-dependent oxidoreductase
MTDRSIVDTEVIVVGAGPNGLLAAGELTLHGVRPLVLDRLPAANTMPKANGLVGRVSEALDRRGLYQAFGGGDRPRPIPGFQFGALDLHLAQLADHALYALPIPQLRMEQILAERAAELGIEVRRGHEVLGLDQDDDRVVLHLRGPDGELDLSARYVVGADGGRSAVRKACGIGFPGVTDTDFVGRTGQVGIDPPVGNPETGELDVPGIGRLRPGGSFLRTEAGLFAFGMFQPGVYRVAAFEHGGSADPATEDWSREDIPLAELAAAIERVLGAPIPISVPPSGQFAQVNRVSNSRQADRYRAGRVLLVGDAAHVHSGMGGPGLNLGMTDVFNLGWKLAAAVRGWAPADLLDSYHRERHPVGERVIMQTRAQSALIGPGPNVTALRQLMDELLAKPANVAHIADLMSGADTRYEMGAAEEHELTGRWLPDLPLHTADGDTRVAEVLRSGRPLLLDLDGRLGKVAAGWDDRVDVLAATTPAPPAAAVLVRPDSHVAWAGEDADALDAALRRWFGEPR